ncbi:MAG: tandem-95 repeat protein, partial [Gammaproteobacteria bacterium]|nr:tandem-95 repeat protein [Gammaproteobacteria bacterium]
TAQNDAPTIEAMISDQRLSEDFSSYSIDLKAAFTDVETGDAELSYAVTGNSNIGVSIVNGVATITPIADWNGSEILTFSASDQGGLSVGQEVVFEVAAVEDIVADSSVQVVEDTPTLIGVVANDSFENTPTVTSVSAPNHGTVVINGDNTLAYTPAANYTGADSFTYTVTSGGLTETASVQITVTEVADLSAMDDIFSLEEDTQLSGSVAVNDTTTSGGVLSYALDSVVAQGTLVFGSDGGFTYTPALNFNGAESFSYRVTDNDSGESFTRTVTLTVNQMNDAATGLPVIAGIPIHGEVLSVDTSAIQDIDGLGRFSFQWLRDGVAIQGATDSSYQLGGSDPGSRISVQVYFTDAAGNTESVNSAQTKTVIPPFEPVDIPQVADPVSDTDIHEESEIDEASEDEPLAEAQEVNEDPDEAQTEAGPVEDFDIAAMVGEIQPLDRSETVANTADQELQRRGINPVSSGLTPLQPRWLDLKNLDIQSFELHQVKPIEMGSVMDNANFLEGLERVGRDLDDEAQRVEASYKIGTEAAVGVTLSLSAGVVSWVLRTGSLMASFMSVVPMWKQFDPLPILGAGLVKGYKRVKSKVGAEEEDSKVEGLFDQDDFPRKE